MGTFRGGRGVVRSYEILSDRGGAVTITLGRHKNPCWGVDGGHDGGRNYTQVVTADGNAGEPTGKTARLPLAKGDVLRIVCGAGGGWGDPAERPREEGAGRPARQPDIAAGSQGGVWRRDLTPPPP